MVQTVTEGGPRRPCAGARLRARVPATGTTLARCSALRPTGG